MLEHDGLIRDTKLPVKVLGVGDAPAGITIHAHAFSTSALDKLAAAGSTVQLLSWPDNAPIDARPAKPEGKRTARRRPGPGVARDGDVQAADADAGESDAAEASATAGEADEADDSEGEGGPEA